MSLKNIFTAVLLLSLFSCTEKNKENKSYLPKSGGTTNLLTIVSDDSLWNGEVGDVTRNIFAAPVYGLPQEEPIFTLKQMNPKAFHDFVKKSRTFIELKKGATKGIKFVNFNENDVIRHELVKKIIKINNVTNNSILIFFF